MSHSQIETTQEIRDLVRDIEYPATPDTLLYIRDLVHKKLEVRPYDNSTKQHEASIRWKRTATEILRDGYIYHGKACTDLVVVGIALCKAIGLETRFVKLKKEKAVHSVAEIKLDTGWYTFDIASANSVPIRGILTEKTPYKDWCVWQKGRDAWDVGLTDLNAIQKIFGD